MDIQYCDGRKRTTQADAHPALNTTRLLQLDLRRAEVSLSVAASARPNRSREGARIVGCETKTRRQTHRMRKVMTVQGTLARRLPPSVTARPSQESHTAKVVATCICAAFDIMRFYRKVHPLSLTLSVHYLSILVSNMDACYYLEITKEI